VKTIILEGALGEKFGSRWELDVRSPTEALRAIEANRPGFFRHLVASDEQGVSYAVLLTTEDQGIECLAESQLRSPFGNETLRIVPMITGAKSSGARAFEYATGWFGASRPGGGQTVLGVALLVVSYFVPWLAPYFVPLGLALIAGGVSKMLTKHPQTDQSTADGLTSYYFSGAQNTAAQGAAVPVGYGRLIVGSVVVSAGVVSDNLRVYT